MTNRLHPEWKKHMAEEKSSGAGSESEATAKIGSENTTQDKAEVPKEKLQGKVSPVSIIFNLVILLLFAGLGYLYWLQRSELEELQLQLAQVQTANNELNSQITDASEQFADFEDLSASTEILLNQQNSRIDSLSEELAALRLGVNSAQNNETILLLTEASSLLRLGQRYLLIAQDPIVTQSLYQRSLNLLDQVDDPAIDRIASLLSSDIELMTQLRGVDVQGIFMQLSDLSERLVSLELGAEIQPSQDFLGQDGPMAEGFFSGVRNFLGRFFTIRRLDEPLQLPLGDEQISFLQQNMQLQLEQAKLGLLQRQQAIYQDSISNVLRLLQQYASESEVQKETVLRDLRELQSRQVVLGNPALSNGPGLLESLLASGFAEE
ncbi:MAG: hypothetical protein CMQ38_06535 [Gammaproteobacteria bacterium]|nr:hypothetical protein [Gammaproteobacteria bacterium]